jgi:Ni/Fe-hydrogenase 1 B-type cytochrome subunit
MKSENIPANHESSLFMQSHSAMIRIWHWVTFVIIFGSIITVLLTSTLMNQRKNIVVVQDQLKAKGLTVSEDQAFAVTREYEDKIWGVHKLLGYGIAFLLISRIVIEIFQPGDEKLRLRIKTVLGLYNQKVGNRQEQLHFLGVKLVYLLFYILLFCMVLTGFGLAFGRELGFSRELHGTVKNIHSLGQYFMYAFVLIHLGGVIIHENIRTNGIVSGMISGNKELGK